MSQEILPDKKKLYGSKAEIVPTNKSRLIAPLKLGGQGISKNLDVYFPWLKLKQIAPLGQRYFWDMNYLENNTTL